MLSGKPNNLALLLLVLSLLASSCGRSNESIHEAAVKADLGKIKKIIAGGVSVNHQDEKKLTVLHIAAYYGQKDHIRLTKWLLKNGADVSLKDYRDKTPLNVAQDRGNKEIAKILSD
tara:strand:+ start:90 stop:440 length:351 start_codon:yes stop_codon:yes gene_type:complete